jgi:prepilin-type N-terminal cleavage/methylation domain-containing protein
MAKFSNTKGGFTLVEVLVSVGIMLIFLPFAASMITNSQLLASYSKHKIQAAYAAQQIIETQRQIISTYFASPLGPLSSGQSDTIGPSSVVLDTKGNYANTNCSTNPALFCGTATITVTPAVYTNSSKVSVTSTTVDHLVVSISWFEQIVKLKVPMTETYAEDIANDAMLN